MLFTRRRDRRTSRVRPPGSARFALRQPTLEALEQRVMLATLPFYDVAGLRFSASDGFTDSGGIYQAATGRVDIGYVPVLGRDVRNLLEYEVDPDTAIPSFELDTTAANPIFSLVGGTFSITAAGGITPFWEVRSATGPTTKVDIGQLIGSGVTIEAGGAKPLGVSAISFTPTLFSLDDPGGDPDAGQVKLQGTAVFDTVPIAKDLGIQVAVQGTNYVLADANGFSLTGLEGKVTLPPKTVLEGLNITGDVTVGYNFVNKTFQVGGGVKLSSTSRDASGEPSLNNVEADLNLTISNGQVEMLNFAVGGSFQLKSLSISTAAGQPIGFSYNLDAGKRQFEVYGKAQAQTASGETTFSVDFGSETSPGITIKDGVLQTLNATINASFEFKAVTLRTDESAGLNLTYKNLTDEITITGGLTLVIAPGTGHSQQIGADLVTQSGGPGLVIRDGAVTSFAIELSGGFDIYGLKLTATGASVAWDPVADKVTLGGAFSVDFKAFQTTLALGTGANPGIVIENGDFAIKAVTFTLANASIGSSFDLKNLVVSYLAVTDPRGQPSYDLTVAVDVLLFSDFEVTGLFQLIDGRLDTIKVDFRSVDGIPLGDTGLNLTEVDVEVDNIETPSEIVVIGALTVIWGEQIQLFGREVSLFRVTGTVTASASELIIDAQAQLGAYSTDGGVTYQAYLGSGDAKLTLDWARQFYSLHIDVNGLAGIFDVEGDLVFAAGQDIAFLATAEVVVPAFVPFIGGLRLGGFGFFFDHVFPHDNVTSSTTLAGWINLDIIWPFTVGFEVYFDAGGNQSFSLIGGNAVANFRQALMPSEPKTFTYLADFAGTVSSDATSLVATVDWARSAPGVGLEGAPTFRVRKTVAGQNPVFIAEADFAANGISFIDRPHFSGPTLRSVQIVGSVADQYRPLGAEYALEVKFTTEGANPFPDFPASNTDDQLKINAAYHVAVPSFGPTGGPQPYLPPIPTAAPTAAFPVTLAGNIDEALIGRARVSLYRVAVDDPFQRGVLVRTSPLTAVTPPANGVNWTATFLVPIDGLDPTRYTLYSILNDGSSADPALAAQANAPIQTGTSAAFTPSFAVQGRVANQNNDPEAGWRVFLDYNRNGVQDPTEPGDTTNADGDYGFTRTFATATGWAPVPVNAPFAVRLIEPAGIAGFAPVAPITTEFNGSATTTAPFPLQEYSAIKGVVYLDAGNTGQAAAGSGVAGVTVYLDLDGDGNLDPGEPTAITDTTGHYLVGNVAAGSYPVRVDRASLVDSTPQVAYVVPANTMGSDAAPGNTYGASFTVRQPIAITQLGVFDDGSNGLTRTLTAVLYDATTHAEVARLVFTPDDPGTLVGGSRFKALAQPIVLPSGFVGMIAAYGYGPGERAGNIAITSGTWTVNGGTALSFESSSYALVPNAYPTIAADPASGSAWAAGTFTHERGAWTVTSPAANGITAIVAAGGFSLSEANNFGVLPPSFLSGTITGGAASTGREQAALDAARVAALNIGGGAVGPFNTDPNPSGGSGFSTSATIDTSRVVAPAPPAVYQTQAMGLDFTYRVGRLTPNVQYLVRLHYAEILFDGPDQRSISVAANGTVIFTDFDVYQAAGGENIAVVREFIATADAAGTIAIRSFSGVNYAILNGLEVLRDAAPLAGWTVQLVADVVAQSAATGEAWAINAGGPTAGVYGADQGATGGSTSTTTNAIDTSQVTDPAPEAVYQSSRFGTFTYTATGLQPNTVYTVRLHFADYAFSAIGQRRFNVAINGVAVLTDFDIVAAAGGGDTAVVRTFTAAADASGTIRFAFANNALISGIEIRPPGGPIAVDAGGLAAGRFAADGGFTGGTVSTDTGVAVDTSRVNNPAPPAVYQTGRFGDDFTYTLTGLIPGKAYLVRLHFAETFFRVAGQRLFNVAINDQAVLTEFDIVATAGGGNIAVVEAFTATAQPDGSLVVHFTQGSAANAFVGGIEVLEPGLIVATTTTDAYGRYAFTTPFPGRYTVREVAPEGWRPVGGTSSSLSFAATPVNGLVQGSVAVADFNGDGLLDYAYSNTEGGQGQTVAIGLLLGGQSQIVYFDTDAVGIKVVVGDFNGDHLPDLATLNSDGSSEVSLLLNTGNASPGQLFTSDNNFWPGQRQLDSVNLVDLAVGDLNNDGLGDLVITYDNRGRLGTGGYAIFLNGTPQTRKVTLYPVVENQPTGVALADINGDGRVDIVFGGAYADPAFEYYHVAYGDGTGGVSALNAIVVEGGAFNGPVALGDIQGLGLQDAAFLDIDPLNQFTSVQTALNQGGEDLAFGGTVLDVEGSAALPLATRIRLADVNGDLRPDLILLRSSRPGDADGRNGALVYLNTGRPSFFDAGDPWWFPTPAGVDTWDLAVADFDTDGLPDIFVSNAPSVDGTKNPATLLTNQSLQGQPGRQVRLGVGEFVSGIDFDNVPLPGSRSVAGRTFHDGNRSGSVETGEGGIGGLTVFADFNGNGRPDLGEATATTRADGSYQLTDLPTGGYRVAVVGNAGWMASRSGSDRADVRVGAVAGRADFLLARSLLVAVGDQRATVGQPVTIALERTADAGADHLWRFSLDPGAPNGATIDPATGLIRWVPTSGPGRFTLVARLRDALDPARTETVPIIVTVAAAPLVATTTSLAVEPSAVEPGTTVVFLVTVTASDGGDPTGLVTFWVDGAAVATASLAVLGQGRARLAVPAGAVGTYRIEATYGGDATHAPSAAGPIMLGVRPRPVMVPGATTTILISPTLPIAPGALFALTVVVAASDGGPATGSVLFVVAGVGDFIVPLIQGGGQSFANLVLGPIAPGTHLVAARFLGSATLAPSLVVAAMVALPTTPSIPPALAVTSVLPIRSGPRLTGLAVRFAEPLLAGPATVVAHYRLTTLRGIRVRVRAAVHDAATQTVRLSIRPVPGRSLARLVLTIDAGNLTGRPGPRTRIILGQSTPKRIFQNNLRPQLTAPSPREVMSMPGKTHRR